jgi:hypothetical protein
VDCECTSDEAIDFDVSFFVNRDGFVASFSNALELSEREFF